MMRTTILLLCVFSFTQVSAQDFESDDWKTFKSGADTTSKSKADSVTVSETTLSTVEENDTMDVTSVESVFPVENDSIAFDPHSNLVFTEKRGEYEVEKDPRIDEIITFLGTPTPPNPIMIDGYRVQILISQDRGEVLEAKTKFMQLYPDMKAYDDWSAPNHYARVGNFRTELQAMKFREEVMQHFKVATVVKCEIELPRLK